MLNGTISRYLDDHLANFIDALEVGHDQRAIQFALESFTIDAGFERFAYLSARGPDSRAFSNYPEEFLRRYLTKNYAALDPVVAQTKRTMRPLCWSGRAMSNLGPDQRQLVSEAEEFGIATGLSIPIRAGFGHVGILTLASSCTDMDTVAVRDAAYAATAVTFVHLNLLRLSAVTMAGADVLLSPREAACLTWASIGKTKSYTARMIGISEKTTRFYLERARAKLGAANITHAVRIAMERGLL